MDKVHLPLGFQIDKKKIWIVVVNSSHARFFKAPSNAKLEEFTDFAHPESRVHISDQLSDKPGHSSGRFVSPRSYSLDREDAQKNEEEHAFAKKITDYLEKSREGLQFNRLYIIANSHFLGVIRKLLTNPKTTELIYHEISKDFSYQTPEEIRQLLPPIL